MVFRCHICGRLAVHEYEAEILTCPGCGWRCSHAWATEYIAAGILLRWRMRRIARREVGRRADRIRKGLPV